MSTIIVVTSGKGGVGKTTTSASIGAGLAARGKKTVVIDFDVGLRNLDGIMGVERRVVYDFVQVIHKEATLNQALIKDKVDPNLFILAASQTRDKDALDEAGVERVLKELLAMGFDFIICDSPAGIETGAVMAMKFADLAIVVSNPEISSVRDADRMIGLLSARARRAETTEGGIDKLLLITRYNPSRVATDQMMSHVDVQEVLGIDVIGVIPESDIVLDGSNQGIPAIRMGTSSVAEAYKDVVARLMGENIPLRFIKNEDGGWIRRLFKRGA